MFINRKSNVSYLKCVAFFSFIRLNNSHISSKVTGGGTRGNGRIEFKDINIETVVGEYDSTNIKIK